MKELDKVFTEKQVEEVSEKVLKSIVEKLKYELTDKFYNEMNSSLYEHYCNVSDDIHKKLIKEITEEFTKDPKDYKFSKLRQKLFNENKELLISTLTDEAIEKTVSNVILQQYTDNSYHFNWMWKDAIVRIITENWDKFKKDKRINNGLLQQIANLKLRINSLKRKLDEFND